MAPPPRSLPEELVEEILLRFPPEDPARLVHAALVCKPWCAVVSGAGFRRRFRKFHRTPPLLGFVSNVYGAAEFVPTCSLPASQVHNREGHLRVVDAHHGRVLLHRDCSWDVLNQVLMVWDPTTDVQEQVSFPSVARYMLNFGAAVLCATAGRCDNLDCLPVPGPFLIVLVGYDHEHSETVVCTYSSSTAASWSTPISSNHNPSTDCIFRHVAHVESALYFEVLMTDDILKFDLESQEISWIKTPTACSPNRSYLLTTTEGGGLGLAAILESSKLYMWSRVDVSHVEATWTQIRVIELNTLLPDHVVLASPDVLDFKFGIGVFFVWSNNVLFAIDLKTYKVIKEVSMATEIFSVIPYMSFYTPAMGVPFKDDKPREGASRGALSWVASSLLGQGK